MSNGVTLVVCTFNGKDRLTKTLDCIASQKEPKHISWEVIVVDNASTDSTGKIAQLLWEKNESTTPFRVVCESKSGLMNARERGIYEANYDIVSFVDDDNWIFNGWVELVWEIMSKHREIGACGGISIAVSDEEIPWWFEKFKGSYAVGPQHQRSGDVSKEKCVLYGAGLTIRKSAWQKLITNGFRLSLVGRKGTSLSCGEDYELCMALRLAGWAIWYEPKLVLCHSISAARLSWNHLRRMVRGWGKAKVHLEPYYMFLKNNPENLMNRVRQHWQWAMINLIINNILNFRKILKYLFYQKEGSDYVLEVEEQIGRLIELIKNRKTYYNKFYLIKNAKWRQRRLQD